MSEYQWIHFKAVDQPLDDDALQFVRKQSTRARVSRWEFTNEYRFGNFHGDTVEMLRRGYDVHLHYANYMIRHLAFRLPELPCGKRTFRPFAVRNEVEWQADDKGNAGILWVTPELDDCDYDYFEGLESMIDRIAPARELMIQGDLRPLYLFWLAGCYDDNAPEPVVPAGLQEVVDGKTNDCLSAIVEFLEIDLDFLTVAARQSPPAEDRGESTKTISEWLNNQPETKLREVSELLLTDVTARNRLLREIQAESSQATSNGVSTSRTFGDLRREVDEMREVRQAELREAARVLKAKQELEDRKRREKQLKQIADDPMSVIRRIDECVATKNRKGYGEATSYLKDFAEAIDHDSAQAEADRLRRDFPSRKALKEELERAGF